MKDDIDKTTASLLKDVESNKPATVTQRVRFPRFDENAPQAGPLNNPLRVMFL